MIITPTKYRLNEALPDDTIFRWLLQIAIAAVGMITNLKQVLPVGGAAIALITVETIFIASVTLDDVYLLT